VKVKLLHYSPLSLAVIGARTCYDSFKNSDCDDVREFPSTTPEQIGDKDKDLLKRLIVLGHESVIE